MARSCTLRPVSAGLHVQAGDRRRRAPQPSGHRSVCLQAAALFQIDVARTATPQGLRPWLAQVGYGQGEAVISPLKLARVSASIASGGTVAPLRWEPTTPGPPDAH